jgi:NCAIR mutase (PurE)-related protein
MNPSDLHRLFEAVRVGRIDSSDAVRNALELDDQPPVDRTHPRIIQAHMLPASELVAQVKSALEHGQNLILEGLDLDGADALASVQGFEYYPLGAIGRIMIQPPPHHEGEVLVIASAHTEAALLEAIEVSLDTFGISLIKETSVQSLTLGQYRNLIQRAQSVRAIVWVAGIQTAWLHPFAESVESPIIVVPALGAGLPGETGQAWFQALLASQPPGVMFVGPNQALAAAVAIARLLPLDEEHQALRDRLTGTEHA